MFAAVQLEQFEIDTQQEKLLFVELFTINTTVIFSFFFKFILFKSGTNLVWFSFFLARAQSTEHIFQGQIISICL